MDTENIITIEAVNFYNPFEYFPYLADIWPIISSCAAQDMTRETVEKNENGLYIVKRGSDIIGLTGFFLNDKPGDPELALRWHGIIPQYRGLGYSRSVLKLVFEKARYEFPDAQYIAEYVPMTDYKDKIIKHFSSLGFEPFKEPFIVGWSIYEMQCYRANIDEFLGKN